MRFFPREIIWIFMLVFRDLNGNLKVALTFGNLTGSRLETKVDNHFLTSFTRLSYQFHGDMLPRYEFEPFGTNCRTINYFERVLYEKYWVQLLTNLNDFNDHQKLTNLKNKFWVEFWKLFTIIGFLMKWKTAIIGFVKSYLMSFIWWDGA